MIGLILFTFNLVVHALPQGVEIKLATEEYKNATNADSTGAYFDIIREIYKELSPKFDPMFTPYARAVYMVKNHSVDFWVASYPNEEEFAIYPKCTFDFDIVSAVSLKDNGVVWKGNDSLTDKPVAWVRGYAYDEYFPEIKFGTTFEVTSNKQGLPMLNASRVTFYIDATSEIKDLFKMNPRFESRMESHKIGHIGLYMAFTNTEKGHNLRDMWDKNFPGLVKSGKIADINDKWGFSNKNKMNHTYCEK